METKKRLASLPSVNAGVSRQPYLMKYLIKARLRIRFGIKSKKWSILSKGSMKENALLPYGLLDAEGKPVAMHFKSKEEAEEQAQVRLDLKRYEYRIDEVHG